MKKLKAVNLSVRKKLAIRKKLLKPFIKKYGSPIIVHGVHSKRLFKKILRDGKLKLPQENNSKKKTPYMEKLLKIDKVIYYTLGFVYPVYYSWKYGFIFDLNFLKETKYYSNSLSYRCYKKIVDYLYEHDRDYLIKFENKNKTCKKVMNKYYSKTNAGKKRQFFDFWEVEKEIFQAIENYPNKKELMKIIKEIQKKTYKKYPSSLKHAKEDFLVDRVPEIISLKNQDLLKSKYFLGFYIKGKVPFSILKILNKKYCGKILFDGKEIKVLE